MSKTLISHIHKQGISEQNACAQEVLRITKGDHIKLKSLCTAKETTNRMKTQSTQSEKKFQELLLI